MNRFKKSTQKFHTEEGVTLVELLAAVAILSIIVTSFLAYFVQAGNTNNRTDKVNQATLLAQGEMEKVSYLLQNNGGLNQVWELYGDKGYDVEKTTEEVRLFKREKFHKILIITISSPGEVNESESKLYNVLVEISEGGPALAKMEIWIAAKDGSS